MSLIIDMEYDALFQVDNGTFQEDNGVPRFKIVIRARGTTVL